MTPEEERAFLRDLANKAAALKPDDRTYAQRFLNALNAMRSVLRPRWRGALPCTVPCTVPPPGWSCSRRAGHDGPCAASPIPPEEDELLPLRDEDYERALAEIGRLWNSPPGSVGAFWLERLAKLVDAYEKKRWPMDSPVSEPPVSCVSTISASAREDIMNEDKSKPWLDVDHPEAGPCLIQVRALLAQLKETSVSLTGVGMCLSYDKQKAAIKVNVEHASDAHNVPTYFEGYEVHTEVTGEIVPLSL